MVLNFKKKNVVGVSVNPETGLEVAQIDFENRVVLKYGRKKLEYDSVAKDIADLDIFQETLFELFTELDIPKGTEIVLNLPSVDFGVVDYPASMDEEQIAFAIEEKLLEHPIFQNTEGNIAFTRLVNSTIQNNKIAYAVTQKTTLIELVMQIKKMGYKVISVDTSVNSMLNALVYNQMIDTSSAVSWVLAIVENSCCRIISMQGQNYIDTFTERISIGEVLGDAENYATVASAINPVIKNLPAQRLFVISTTNLISAQELASKLIYNAQIVHLDSNYYAKRPIMSVSEFITDEEAKKVSLEIIGAAINKDFAPYSTARLNLFNKNLGDIWENEQPLLLKFGGLELELSLDNMIVASIVVGALLVIIMIGGLITFSYYKNTVEGKIQDKKSEIERVQAYLDKNNNISADLFDEGDEIRVGLSFNKNIYSYYSLLGTEIPQKVWLTKVVLSDNVVIAGQGDNLESVYSFYRNLKDYTPKSDLLIQKLALASDSQFKLIEKDKLLKDKDEEEEEESFITSLNADYYEFVISDVKDYEAYIKSINEKEKDKDKDKDKADKKSTSKLGDLVPAFGALE